MWRWAEPVYYRGSLPLDHFTLTPAILVRPRAAFLPRQLAPAQSLLARSLSTAPLVWHSASQTSIARSRSLLPPRLSFTVRRNLTKLAPMSGPPPTKTAPLPIADGLLVWIDCEMTGLDPQTDVLLEIAVIITDGNLIPVDEGIEYIISTPRSILDNMDPWCVDMHGKTGLTAACLAEPKEHDVAWVEERVLDYITRWVPSQRVGVLAGNSVHADRAFLAIGMKKVVEHLHYRIVDVSSIKELVKRWHPKLIMDKNGSESKHRALDDIQWSIKELKYYRENVFIKGE